MHVLTCFFFGVDCVSFSEELELELELELDDTIALACEPLNMKCKVH